MQKFELVIRDLLKEHPDVNIVADRALRTMESEDLYFGEESIRTMSQFLHHSGLYLTLVQFVIRNFRRPRFKVPWYLFLESLAKGLPADRDHLPDQLLQAILTGIEADQAHAEAAQARSIRKFLPIMETWGKQEEKEFKAFAQSRRDELIQQAHTLKAAMLYEKANILINQLLRLFPNDREVMLLKDEAVQQAAYDTLQRRSLRKTEVTFVEEVMDAQEQGILNSVGRSLYQAALTLPHLSFDLASSAILLDDHETALKILNHAEPEFRIDWLRVESLLQLRRFLEALDWLVYLEIHYAHKAEIAAAIMIVRARALWGMGERHIAHELLEAIVANHPGQTEASMLLNTWRNQ